ncbi:hypothetical protein L1987_83470 [Smallanthus sonchifolius]|uniref:Uncharacterized protein n=1 Tax=Smallanthus sonchifolius TaxID=185202 RepID=A0ACB8YGD0_9ASTR|nr:hypothetical protein L1987_83470 [Smallanthus sonchifolius]
MTTSACIKEVYRSALVAFAPDAPFFAAGTMAGAVDMSFSSSANLELFKLDFNLMIVTFRSPVPYLVPNRLIGCRGGSLRHRVRKNSHSVSSPAAL